MQTLDCGNIINLAIQITDRSMTKRLHFTLAEVLDKVVSDDENMDDPDEPMMEGSDDEFSDLDVDDDIYDEDDIEMDTVTTGSDTLTGSASQTIHNTQGLLFQFPLRIFLVYTYIPSHI